MIGAVSAASDTSTDDIVNQDISTSENNNHNTNTNGNHDSVKIVDKTNTNTANTKSVDSANEIKKQETNGNNKLSSNKNEGDLLKDTNTPGTFSELQTNITKTPYDGTINLNKDYHYDTGVSYTGILIENKKITINGNGYTLDAQGKSRIFTLKNATLILDNLKIINGKIEFKQTSADDDGFGGAIWLDGDSILNITNSQFTNNQAGWYGGAIYINHATLTVINSTFNQNQADYAGGAIYINHATLTVINSTFNQNQADNAGGAIYTAAYGSNLLKVMNSLFNKNTAETGDGIFNMGATCVVGDSVFIDNTIDSNNAFSGSTTAYDTEFTNEDSFVALYGLINVGNPTPIVTLTNNFNFNDSESSNDTHFIHGIPINHKVTIDANGYTINGLNKARIFTINTQDPVTIKNINFINGNAGRDNGEDGGAIYNSNTDINCLVEKCKFTGNHADEDGGALYQVNANHCQFISNTAGDSGGAMYKGSANNCNFTSNQAGDAGGAIDQGTATNCNFTSNDADEGGAIYFGTANNCQFKDNTGYGKAMYWGTAIFCTFNEENPCEGTKFQELTAVSPFTTTYQSGDKLLFNLKLDSTEYPGIDTDIKVYKNDNPNTPIKTGTAKTGNNNGWNIPTDLTVGTYNLVLSLDKYSIAPKTIELKILAYATSITVSGDSNVIAHTENTATINLKNGTAPLQNQKVNITITDEYNNVLFKDTRNTNSDGQISITYTPITNGTITINALFEGTDLQSGNSTTKQVTVNDINTNLILTVTNTTIDKANNITVNIKDTNNKPVNGTITLSFNDGTPNIEIILDGTNTEFKREYSNTDKGKTVQVTATYLPQLNSAYKANMDTKEFTVNKLNTTIDLVVNNPTINQFTVNITINGKDTIRQVSDGSLIIYVDNAKVGEAEVNNGKAENIPLTINKFGDYTLKVEYGGNTIFNANDTYTKLVTAIKIQTNTDLELINNTIGNLTFKVTVKDTNKQLVDSGNVNITALNNEGELIFIGNGTITNGVVFIKNSTLNIMDTYSFTAYYNGTEIYNVSNKTISSQLNTRPTKTTITILNNTYNNVTIKVSVIDNETNKPLPNADVKITSPTGKIITIKTDNNGINITVIDVSAGPNQIFKAEYPGNKTYTTSTDTITTNINKITPTFTIQNIPDINEGSTIELTVTENNNYTGSLNLTISTETHIVNMLNGNGKLTITPKLSPGTYTAKIDFKGNENYTEATATSNQFKINSKPVPPSPTPTPSPTPEPTPRPNGKVATKIFAKQKTFKLETKNKKYTITLKDTTGNTIQKAKVTLKVKGKTYKATTNNKGKASFKITKLNKKGTYTAIIKYKGNKSYKATNKKIRLTVKKVKKGFKTIGKNSKNKKMIKKIQKALKKNGYYQYEGKRYLKIDGIYHKWTQKAVKQYQKAKKLPVTGTVNYPTAQKLKITN